MGILTLLKDFKWFGVERGAEFAFFMYNIMSSADSDNFPFSCPVGIPLPFLLWLLWLRTSNTMLNESGNSGCPCLVPDLGGNTWSLPLLRMVLAVAFIYSLYYVEVGSSIPTLLRTFIINGYWILSKAILCPFRWLCGFYSLLMWCITLICGYWEILAFFGINPTWSWCTSLLICCWIRFAVILLRIFASVFVRNTGL